MGTNGKTYYAQRLSLKIPTELRPQNKIKKTNGYIIEANTKDTLFSFGLSLHHPNLHDESKWKGKNLLGQILCEVRDSLQVTVDNL